MFTPYNHPLNWYQYEVLSSVELLTAYVADIERQVAAGIADYEANAEKVVIDEEHGQDAVRIVEVYKDLDNEGWHLPEIFVVYFPNLQRRSALITLCSFFEHEIDKLCDRLQKQENLLVRFVDMAGKGVKRSAVYLEKVVGIDAGQDSPTWVAIKEIQKIRNLVVHANGRLVDHAKTRKKAEDAIVAKSPFLEGSTEVLLKDGYLSYALRTCDAYFKLLDQGIQARYSA